MSFADGMPTAAGSAADSLFFNWVARQTQESCRRAREKHVIDQLVEERDYYYKEMKRALDGWSAADKKAADLNRIIKDARWAENRSEKSRKHAELDVAYFKSLAYWRDARHVLMLLNLPNDEYYERAAEVGLFLNPLKTILRLKDFKAMFLERNYEKEIEEWIFGKYTGNRKQDWYYPINPISSDTKANLAFIRRNWIKIAHGLARYEEGLANGKERYWPIKNAEEIMERNLRKIMEDEENSFSPSF